MNNTFHDAFSTCDYPLKTSETKFFPGLNLFFRKWSKRAGKSVRFKSCFTGLCLKNQTIEYLK